MPTSDAQHLGYENQGRGRLAERAFQYGIEKYFPKSVFTPVSHDDMGFDGNLILRADAAPENTMSVYFQVKVAPTPRADGRLAVRISNVRTLRALLQHDYAYLAVIDIDNAYVALGTEEPPIYLVNLHTWLGASAITAQSLTVAVGEEHRLTIRSAHAVAGAVWAHRYGQQVDDVLHRGGGSEVAAAVDGWITDPVTSPRLDVDTLRAVVAGAPPHLRVKVNSFLGAFAFLQAVIDDVTVRTSPASFFTVANETAIGIDMNLFIMTTVFQRYMDVLSEAIADSGSTMHRNFVLQAADGRYHLLQRLNFLASACYMLERGVLVTFTRSDEATQVDYFSAPGTCVELRSYVGTEGPFEFASVSAVPDDVLAVIGPAMAEVIDRATSLEFLHRVLDLGPSILPPAGPIDPSLCPPATWLYRVPPGYQP